MEPTGLDHVHLDHSLEPYCILCRMRLPVVRQMPNQPMRYAQSRQQPKEWDAEMILFWKVPRGQGHPGRYCRGMYSVDVRNNHTILRIAAAIPGRHLDLCSRGLGCAQCSKPGSNRAHFVHAHCFKLAFKILPSISLEHLLVLARLTRTILPGIIMPPYAFMSMSGGCKLFFSESENHQTELGQLLATVATKLPLEVQHMIHDHTDMLLKSVSSCIWNLENHCRPYLVNHLEDHPPTTSFPLSDAPTVDILGANVTSILGEDTMVQIGTGERKWQSKITLPDRNMVALQIAFSSYGVAAVRLLYEDGSKSPWVGSGLRKWFRTIKSSDIKLMRTTFDGFKIVDLDLPTDAADPCPHPDTALWDYDTHSGPERKFFLLDFISRNDEEPLNPQLRIIKSLPLDSTAGEVRSLTVFTYSSGTSHIQLNDDATNRLGMGEPNLDQRPSTYYFRPGESIESVHLITQGFRTSERQAGPFLVILTSDGRTQYFGPYSILIEHGRILTSIGDCRTHKVAGLISQPSPAIKCMGVVMEPRDEESRQDFHEHLILPHREMPDVGRDIMDRYPGDTMLSKASLVDVVCLKTQGLVTPEGRVSRRHGLCIEHRNGAIDVLGQWDAADRTEVLWEEKTGGVLEAITFVYQNFGNPLERKVQSIHAERVDRAGVHKFVWDDATKEVVWLSARFCDRLEYWNETTERRQVPAFESGNVVIDLE